MKTLISAVFTLLSGVVYSQSCTVSNAASSINWTNATAITCAEGGNLSTKSILIIPSGKTIVFNDNSDTWTGTRIEVNGTLSITAPGQVTINASLVVNSGGTVGIDSKLNLGSGTGCGYTLTVKSGGTLDIVGSTPDRLNICGVEIARGGTAGCNNSYPSGSPSYCEPSGGFTGPTGFDENGYNGALPVNLSYFRATLEESGKTLLEWGTSQEDQFDHFEIERSVNDFTFKPVLTVDGAGYNTNSLQKYAAYDQGLIGTNYYRIKAVDTDGSYQYFRVVSVINTSNRAVWIAPNPVEDHIINFAMNFEPESSDHVVLIDALGREVASSLVSSSENQLVVGDRFQAGLYFLHYVSPKFQKSVRVLLK